MTNMEIVLDRWATKAVNLMKDTLKNKKHFSSGSLINSISYDITKKGVQFEMNKYGEAIEKGRRPAFIPIKVLVDWIIRKNIKFKTKVAGKPLTAKEARGATSKNAKKAHRGRSAQKEALGMAIAISRAAKARSGKGLYTGGKTDPFVKPAIDKTFKTKTFENEIRIAAKQDMIELLKKNKIK